MLEIDVQQLVHILVQVLQGILEGLIQLLRWFIDFMLNNPIADMVLLLSVALIIFRLVRKRMADNWN